MMLVLDFYCSVILFALLHSGSTFPSSRANLNHRWSSVISLSDKINGGLTGLFVAQNSTVILSQSPLISIDEVSTESNMATVRDVFNGIACSDSSSYETDRISYNMELQNLLYKGKQAEVISKLQKLKDQDVKLNVDTIHIMISDSFSRKDTATVEQLYRQYFKSQSLSPTSRTLNILMEGYRMLRDESKVYYYRDCFEQYNLAMDSYSYSSLIRTARTAASIKSILCLAESGKSLSPPLMRCAIESLGKLEDPLGAVIVAGRMSVLSDASAGSRNNIDDSGSCDRKRNSLSREGNQEGSYLSRSMFDSVSSGDSLLVALLENPYMLLVPISEYGELENIPVKAGQSDGIGSSTRNINLDGTVSDGAIRTIPDLVVGADLGVGSMMGGETSTLERRVRGMRCGEAAIHLVLAASPSDSVISAAASGLLASGSEHGQRDILVCGSKGWCRLFTFLQRSMKDSLEELELNKSYNGNNKMKIAYEASKQKLKKLRDTRDRLWVRLASEILETEAEALSRTPPRIDVGNEENMRLDGKGVLVTGIVDDNAVIPAIGSASTGSDPVPVMLASSPSSLSAPSSSTATSTTTSTSVSQSNPTSTPWRSGAGGGGGRSSRGGVELNGRLSDALLRCYVEDAEKAKKMWKNNILPMAKRLSTGRTFDEVCEKSLEALMFVSGYNGRADLGFEIALTVRNRNWGANSRTKLGKSYVQGKLQSRGQKSQWLKSNILNDGLERSIESELGVQLLDFYYPEPSSSSFPRTNRKWPERIRIQFKPDTPPPAPVSPPAPISSTEV